VVNLSFYQFTFSNMKDKNGTKKLLGYCIFELGEFVGMRKTNNETVCEELHQLHRWGQNMSSDFC
jgi:hypothetical protein